MLNEIYLALLAPLEDYGIIPPDSMMPDISTGLMFSGFLRRKGIDTSQFPSYDISRLEAVCHAVNIKGQAMRQSKPWGRHHDSGPHS